MAESLAVRWRPRRFADVTGQRHVVAVLKAAAARTAPPQQILLAGPSGLGKTTTARIFAAALLCEFRGPDGDACGLCESCLAVTGPAGAHPDVVELDAASNGGKDEIRDLAARAVLGPMRGRWKVYIVDEAHGLTGPGGQAFLRLLEEPPSHCVFVLATTDPGKLPVALQGRCIYLEVLPPSAPELAANLRRIAAGEDWDLSQTVTDAVLAASDPALGVRGTVMTLDKLAGHLSAGRDVRDSDLEDLLGVAGAADLGALTAAICGGRRDEALQVVLDLIARLGEEHVRAQLVAWAATDLRAALAVGEATSAFHRYVTFVEAPTYFGALPVAVARAADPSLSPTPHGVAAFLDLAEARLGELRALLNRAPSQAPASSSSATATDKASRTLSTARQEVATDAATAAVAVETSACADHGTMQVLPATDPQVLTLLNLVSKVHPAAAFVLRRCQVRTDGSILQVHVPADQVAKADSSDLAGALDKAGVDGNVRVCVVFGDR